MYKQVDIDSLIEIADEEEDEDEDDWWDDVEGEEDTDDNPADTIEERVIAWAEAYKAWLTPTEDASNHLVHTSTVSDESHSPNMPSADLSLDD